jgi:RHS repeat-associated protein
MTLQNTNGKILIAGGKNGSTVLSSAIVFDPSVSNGTWSSAGTMTTPRVGHTMTLLPNTIVANGQVLVTGGSSNGTTVLSSAELFSGTSTWTATPSMPGPSQGHQAVLLSGNMILAAGGLSSSSAVQNAAYLYDASFGLACSSNSQCASGFCANGICCDTACNGGTCAACNLAGHLGTCTAQPSGTVCRAQNGACDAAETCDGSSFACPADGVQPLGTVCRGVAGDCDVPETCDGQTKACPADQFAGSTTVCRPATTICDAPETCTGTSAACPADAYAAAGTVCRPIAGGCDAPETCTGTSTVCPADTFAAGGTVCRPAESLCDVAEICSGTTAACPTDTYAPAGTTCGAASGSSPGPVCSGTDGTCPETGTTSDILGFEEIADWGFDASASATVVGLSSNRTQGVSAFEVTAQGSARLNSAPLSSIGGINPVVLLDIQLPTSQADPTWYGDVQLLVNSSSLGINNVSLGDVQLTGLALGTWQTLAFQLPASTAAAIASGVYSDLIFSIVLNVPSTETGHYFLDNVRSVPDVTPALLGVAQDGATIKAVFDYVTTSSTPIVIPYGLGNGLANQSGFMASPPEAPPTTFVSARHAPFVATLSGPLLRWTVGSHTAAATPTSPHLAVTTLGDGTHDATLPDGRKVNLDSTAPQNPTVQPEPATGAPFAGVLNGTFSVTSTGAATYTLPIAIPPGLSGMAPNLALSYSSQGPDGVAGQGWQLTGLSMIYRCPKTRVQDGVTRPVQMDSLNDSNDTVDQLVSGDGLCLDGKRIFDRGGGVYESETKDFTVITKVVDANSILSGGDPTDSVSFQILTKDGQIRYYGSRTNGDSRVVVTNPPNQYRPPEEIAVWLLDRVTDQWGNYYDIHYNGDFSSTETLFTSLGIYVSQIDYTGHFASIQYPVTQPASPPFYSIKFAYEPRSDVRRTRFAQISIPQIYRLKGISTFKYGETTNPLSTYSLTYLPDTDVTLPSQLDTISYTAGATQLPPIKFDWYGGSYGWTQNDNYALPGPIERIADNTVYGSSWFTNGPPPNPGTTHGTQILDLDGDGLPDFVVAKAGQPRSVSHDNGLGWSPAPSNWTLPGDLVKSDGTPSGGFFVDVDGDGLPDFVTSDGGFTIWLNRIGTGEGWVQAAGQSLPSGWDSIDFTKHDTMVDMNGDGKADLVRFGPEWYQIQVLQNTFGGWVPLPGNYNFPFGYGCSPTPDVCYHLTDINRDGLPDLVANGDDLKPDFRVLINLGPNDLPQAGGSVWLYQHTGTGIGDPTMVSHQFHGPPAKADIDGDGMYDGLAEWSDTFLTDSSGIHTAIAYSGGYGWVSGANDAYTAAIVHDLAGISNAWLGSDSNNGMAAPGSLQLTDINADGLADLIIAHSNGGQVLINRGSSWADIDSTDAWHDLAGPNRLPVTPDDYAGVTMVDVNGDGLLDLVQATCGGHADCVVAGGPVMHTWLNTYIPPAISTFPNGVGLSSQAVYRSISTYAGHGSYTDSGTRDPGTMRMAAPMNVVVLARQDNGLGALNTKTYQYTDLRTSAYGRGPQGFKTVTETDQTTKAVTTTTYAQSYPYTGMPIKVDRSFNTTSFGPVAMATTETTYCDKPNDGLPAGQTPDCTPLGSPSPAPGTSTFVYPLSVTDTTYMRADAEQSLALLGTNVTKTAYTYNAMGNPTQIGVEQDYMTGETYLKTTTNEYTFGDATDIVARSKATKITVTTQRTAPADNNNAPITHVTNLEYTQVSTYTTPDASMSPEAIGLILKQVEPGLGTPLEQDTAYAYDGYGNLTTTTVCASDFTHCSAGGHSTDSTPFRTTVTSYDPNAFNAPAGPGLISTVPYGPGRFPVKTTNAALQTEYFAYDPTWGQLVQHTGLNGIHTCYAYDDLGREKSETTRCGSVAPVTSTTSRYYTTSTDPGLAKVVTISRPADGAASWLYTDALNRTVAKRARGFGGGFTETLTNYYSTGQVFTESSPHDVGGAIYLKTFSYDPLLRVVTITQDLGQINSSGPATDSMVTHYLGAGVLTDRVINGQHQQRYEEKNALAKTDHVTDAAGGTIWYRYDADGNLTDAGDPAGSTIPTVHTTYDLRGRKTASTDPDLGTWSYQYNGFGDLMSQTDAKGQTITMGYDVLGRMTSKTDAATGDTAQWLYDTAPGAGVGKLAAMVSEPNGKLNGSCALPTGITVTGGDRAVKQYSYGQLGELRQTDECADGTVFTTTYEYDALGRQNVIHYPVAGASQLSVGYHYTNLGYLQYLTDESTDYGVLWQAKTMNALGQVTDEQMRNGVETAVTRNPSTGWAMASSSTAHADGDTLIQSWATSYDEAGNLLTRTRSDAINDAPSTEYFGYDLLNRVTSSHVTLTSLGYDRTDNYGYDGLGNLTSKGVKAYNYGTGCGGPHAVCSVTGGASYGYDANGNMMVGGGRTIIYDVANKPLHVEQDGPSGNNVVEFAYGADGNRVLQTASANGTTSRTVYVGLGETGKSLYERTAVQGAYRHTYFIYAGGAAGGNAFAVRILDNSGNVTENDYLNVDHLGSTTAVSDYRGHVASVAAAGPKAGVLGYDPWGARRNPDGQSVDDPSVFQTAPGNREFTGQESIPAMGLINMNGRVYDPILGRFLSADPNIQFVADLQSYNRYTYVHNNPLRYTDPTGYSIFGGWEGTLVGLGIGALGIAACVGTSGAGCGFFFAWIGAIYSATGALANGASNGQAIAIGAVTGISGFMGGGLAGAATAKLSTNLATQILAGAIGGAVSSALSSVALTGSVGWENVLVSAATGAASAAAQWAISGPPPVDEATAAKAQGGGSSGESVAEARATAQAAGAAAHDASEAASSHAGSAQAEVGQGSPAQIDRQQAADKYGAVDLAHHQWAGSHQWLVRYDVPQGILDDPSYRMVDPRGNLVTHFWVNRDLVPMLNSAFQNLQAAGGLDELDTFNGTFNVRGTVRGSISAHSWGIAIDVNAAANPLGHVPTMAPVVVRSFTDAGFTWGGTWSGRSVDGMHFSLGF